MSDEARKDRKKVIFVNKKEITVREDKLDGAQILTLARLEPEKYDLFLIRGQHSDKIEPNQVVEIKDGMRFNAILKSVPYG